MNPIKISNAKYARQDQSMIDCIVVFEELKDRFPNGLPFTASLNDIEPHTAIIFNKIKAGEAGEIAPWEPPSNEEIAILVRSRRDDLLIQLDQIVMNPIRYNSFSDVYKQALANYRQQLLDVPQQEGFPNVVTFPEMPQQ